MDFFSLRARTGRMVFMRGNVHTAFPFTPFRAGESPVGAPDEGFLCFSLSRVAQGS